MSDSASILLHFQRDGKSGMGVLTAKLGTETLAVERLNITSSERRAAFVGQLTTDKPGIDAKAVESELLRLAGQTTAIEKDKAAGEGSQAVELDVSHIVRPELFYTLEVSGVTIPTARLFGDKPIGQWLLHLRWHSSGKREQRKLTNDPLELPDGGKLWLFPTPGAPLPTHRPDWTAKGRKAWLDGAPAPEPVDVFRRTCERIAWFLDFASDVASGVTATLALWVLLTYVYVAWPSVPYLSIGGPLSSGKTTLFRVLARLCFRPLKSSTMSAASLFRTLHDRGGVLFLDEAERLKDGSPEALELRSVLLSGYKRGSPAMRVERVGDSFRPCEFDVFGPKAFAAIARLPEALASRCIRLVMFRAELDSAKPRRRLDAQPGEWADLRDDMHALALEYGPMWLRLAERDDVCPESFGGRDFELWQPLLALAAWLDEAGADGLLDLVTEFAGRLTGANRDDSLPDCDETLLRILANHVQAGTNVTLKAGDILTEAREADPATFGTKDRPKWSPKGVATAIRRYQLETTKGTGNRGRTYSRVTVEDMRRVERVYGFELGLSGTDVPHVPQVPQVPQVPRNSA